MLEIAQIRRLSIWIFLIPLLAINICLFISQNPGFLDNTIFEVDQIGRSGFSIPYLDGSLSISRASRTFPQYLIFKPSMIMTAILLYYYWNNYIYTINYFFNFSLVEIWTEQKKEIHHKFLVNNTWLFFDEIYYRCSYKINRVNRTSKNWIFRRT